MTTATLSVAAPTTRLVRMPTELQPTLKVAPVSTEEMHTKMKAAPADSKPAGASARSTSTRSATTKHAVAAQTAPRVARTLVAHRAHTLVAHRMGVRSAPGRESREPHTDAPRRWPANAATNTHAAAAPAATREDAFSHAMATTSDIPPVAKAMRGAVERLAYDYDEDGRGCNFFRLHVGAAIVEDFGLNAVARAAAIELARVRGTAPVAASFVLVAEGMHRDGWGLSHAVSCEASEVAPQDLEALVQEESSRVASSLSAMVRFPSTCLEVLRPDGTSWRATTSCFVGRSASCSLVVDDVHVSSTHAQLVCDVSGTWSIVDLGSVNGTQVSGKPVRMHALAPDDTVSLGKVPAFVVQSIEALAW